MPIFGLFSDTSNFPPTHLAEPDGLLAVGGDLSPERLLRAYQNGIFPWYNPDEIIQWWSPDPRYVIFPKEVYISKTMRQVLRRNHFKVTFNKAFNEVIRACSAIERPDQDGTWLSEEMIAAYQKLHDLGYAHSVEVWKDDKLSGGLYGLALADCFFGESMFSYESNASKTALITLSKKLEEKNFQLIDCQIPNDHLLSMGATPLPREDFLKKIENCKNCQPNFGLFD